MSSKLIEAFMYYCPRCGAKVVLGEVPARCIACGWEEKVESSSAEKVAAEFHRVYELLAPEFGYETREASAVPWDQVPEANRKLMCAVVQRLLDEDVIQLP